MHHPSISSPALAVIPGGILAAWAILAACFAVVGVVRGSRTWWGLLLIVPALLLGLYSGFILLVMVPTLQLDLLSLLGLLLLLFPLALALFFVWHWWQPDDRHGA